MTDSPSLRARASRAYTIASVGSTTAIYAGCLGGDLWLVGVGLILGAAVLAMLLPGGQVGRYAGITAFVLTLPVSIFLSSDPINFLLHLIFVFGTYQHVRREFRLDTRPGPAAAPSDSRQATAAPPESRLPAGVADERLLDRLAVHEMTRARRYEHPLTLLLVDIDNWSALSTERGKRGAFEQITSLAIRIRRLLRDVDAIGLHGNGQLAILLPETPLDGALVVAGRIEEAARDDVGLAVRVGAAVFPDDSVSVEGLLQEAEAAVELARLEKVAVAQRVLLT